MNYDLDEHGVFVYLPLEADGELAGIPDMYKGQMKSDVIWDVEFEDWMICLLVCNTILSESLKLRGEYLCCACVM